MLHEYTQMFSQERFEASFEIAAPKSLKKYTAKTYVIEFPLDKIAQLQSTAYYRTKNLITDYFSWSAQKPLQNCFFFSNITNLQTRILDFNKNVDTAKKNFFWMFSEIVTYKDIYQEKICNEVKLLKYQDYYVESTRF